MESVTNVASAATTDGANTEGQTEVVTPSSLVVPYESTIETKEAPDENNIPNSPPEKWDSKISYLLVLIGYAVGFGNLWRFPYLLQKNGGAAFLVPYTFFLFAAGIPIFLLEIAVGQRFRKGSFGCWNEISPLFAGLGISVAIVNLIVAYYYNTLLAWVFYYVISSFNADIDNNVPWANCKYHNVSECTNSTPSQYYWYRQVLDATSGIEDPGNFSWPIVAANLASWVVTWICMVGGTNWTGKVVYFTATYPYMVLITFLIVALAEGDFAEGFKLAYAPKWEKLLDGKVWLDAGVQIFFSLGVGFGSIISYASYLKPNNNCYFDAFLVSIVNCGTSFFASIVLFIIFGHRAQKLRTSCLKDNKDFNMSHINDTYTNGTKPAVDCSLQRFIDEGGSGTGLVFITFADAVADFPWFPPLWSILFFTMLATLGLDSCFGNIEPIIATFIDIRVYKIEKWVVTTVVCSFFLVASISFGLGNGVYILTYADEMCAGWPLMAITVGEIFIVAYVYGLKKFSMDITLMTGKRPGWYFMLCWKFITPLSMVVILLCSIYSVFATYPQYTTWNKEAAKEEMKAWPIGLYVISIIITTFTMLPIPVVLIAKKLGFNIFKTEIPNSFPEDELRDQYNFDERLDKAGTSSLQKLSMVEGIQDAKDFLSSSASRTSIKSEKIIKKASMIITPTANTQ